MKKINLKLIIAISAIVICLLIGGGIYYFNNIKNKSAEYYTIDCVSSIEVRVDTNQKVKSAKGLNSQGKDLLKSVNPKGQQFEDALKGILNKAVSKGYITKDKTNDIIISMSRVMKSKGNKSRFNGQNGGNMQNGGGFNRQNGGSMQSNGSNGQQNQRNGQRNFTGQMGFVNDIKDVSGIPVKIVFAIAMPNDRSSAQKQHISTGLYLVLNAAKKLNINITAADINGKDIKGAIEKAGGNFDNVIKNLQSFGFPRNRNQNNSNSPENSNPPNNNSNSNNSGV